VELGIERFMAGEEVGGRGAYDATAWKGKLELERLDSDADDDSR